MKRIRYSAKDFTWVSWTTKELQRLESEIIALKKGRYALIKAIPARERTFENTIRALAIAGDSIADRIGCVEILQNMSPDKKVRDAASALRESLGKKLVDIEYDPDIYIAVKDYTKKKEKLTGADFLLCRDIEREYDRMGFSLSKEKQRELKANIKKIEKLGIAFDRNLNEYKDSILVTKEELAGLPETYIQTLKKNGKGLYQISLAYPEVLPFLGGADNEKKRKELFEKNIRKGGKKNITLLAEMIRLRARNARILGYPTHADFEVELRMAGSAKKIAAFLTDLEKKTKKAGERDLAMLRAFKKSFTKNKRAKVYGHDVAYLFKQIRKQRFAIDSDYVKEHFPFEHVKETTLAIYQEVLGVTFKRRKDLPIWHEDVQTYDVFDASGDYLATFALDLYPREGKYGHAAVFPVIGGREENGKYVAPFSVLVTNVMKPGAGNPSLLGHGEVETFFHEFGHLVHDVLTKACYHAQSGTNVARDFVEAPSQMLENWIWDKAMLRRLSSHYTTNEPLSKESIENMIKARSFGEAWSVRGQLVYAFLDQEIHTKKIQNINAVYARLTKKFLGIAAPKSQLFLAGFGHLAHGYDAGYYGYLWSRVYAEDMFTRFEKEGVLNPKTGRDYRTWILEKGSSMEEIDLITGFLKRAPNNKAFLKSIGI